MPTTGGKEIAAKLRAIRNSVGGHALQQAATYAMQAAKEQAQQGAPVAEPPYGPYAGHRSLVDPYPRKTYKGRRVAPGFTRRNIKLVSKLTDDGSAVRVALGVAKEAFYSVLFLEFGTSKMAKRAWLEPSFRYSVKEVDRLFRQRLLQLLDKAAGK